MDKELALRTFAYLIGHYKTHDETTINKQEIEAIEFMLKNNENLEQQCKKQKEVIDKAMDIINDYLKEDYSIYTENEIEVDLIVKLKNILNEVSE